MRRIPQLEYETIITCSGFELQLPIADITIDAKKSTHNGCTCGDSNNYSEFFQWCC